MYSLVSHIAVDGPLAGRLFDGQVLDDGATVDLEGNRMRVAEPEFCFRMGRTLSPRAQPSDHACGGADQL